MKKSVFVLGAIIAFAVVGLAASTITSSVVLADNDDKKDPRNENAFKVCGKHHPGQGDPKKCEDNDDK